MVESRPKAQVDQPLPPGHRCLLQAGRLPWVQWGHLPCSMPGQGEASVIIFPLPWPCWPHLFIGPASAGRALEALSTGELVMGPARARRELPFISPMPERWGCEGWGTEVPLGRAPSSGGGIRGEESPLPQAVLGLCPRPARGWISQTPMAGVWLSLASHTHHAWTPGLSSRCSSWMR